MTAALFVFAAVVGPALGAKTIVTQSIRTSDGSFATGSALIRISTPCKSGSTYVDDKTIKVMFTDGAFSVALVPNDSCIPSGTSYTVAWLIAGSATRTESWRVPTSGAPVTVDSVIATPERAIRLGDAGPINQAAGTEVNLPVLKASTLPQADGRLPVTPNPPDQPDQDSPTALLLTVGKSAIIDSDLPFERISVGFGDIAEGTAISPRQLLVNAKTPGVTSLIIWREGGTRRFFDITVLPSRFLVDQRLEGVKHEIERELPGQSVNLSFESDTVFLRGTVKDVTSADRAVSIASTLGKTVNLLYVDVPPPPEQILLKVKFASVDRSVRTQLGLNILSTGAANTIGSITTQQYSPPGLSALQGKTAVTATISDALNLFFFRPDLNLGATIEALEVKGLLQILAEPNMLAEDGKQASFLAGGEFPFPSVSAGSGGAPIVSIQFREFGVRLTFIPTITARGTIHLEVAPEVSALDFSSGLSVSGFNVPALTTRRLNTQVELNQGQSFAIGGLLDNRTTDILEKIPLIGSIPILGRLFQSKSVSKQNTELIVIVTPELVRPIPAGQPTFELKYPRSFLESNTGEDLWTPGKGSMELEPVKAPNPAIPIEKLIQSPPPAMLPVQQTPPPTAGSKSSGAPPR